MIFVFSFGFLPHRASVHDTISSRKRLCLVGTVSSKTLSIHSSSFCVFLSKSRTGLFSFLSALWWGSRKKKKARVYLYTPACLNRLESILTACLRRQKRLIRIESINRRECAVSAVKQEFYPSFGASETVLHDL